MKKLVSILFLLVLCFSGVIKGVAFAELSDVQAENETIFRIYSETGDLLAEKQSVFVGDSLLTTDFVKYKITQIDEENGIAFAEFEERLRKPEVNFNFQPTKISQKTPTICLYMTHNDESYINGDGVDSVYGAGGVHDIAKLLKSNFEDLGIKTVVDETLHIPHDNYAYSRSKSTATNLLSKYSPDAIFDIHRDGASRRTYVKNVNGVERCKIRIVVGKASENYEIAEQFALYLLSVANEVCDWLFLDIYYASGHYNQGLYSKALLFEMGSHLVEKSLVEKSVPELSKVIKTALFKTTVDNDGDLTINGEVDDKLPVINENHPSNSGDEGVENANPTISEALDLLYEEKNTKTAPTVTYLVVVVFGAGVVAGVVLGVVKKKPKKKKAKK